MRIPVAETLGDHLTKGYDNHKACESQGCGSGSIMCGQCVPQRNQSTLFHMVHAGLLKTLALYGSHYIMSPADWNRFVRGGGGLMVH